MKTNQSNDSTEEDLLKKLKTAEPDKQIENQIKHLESKMSDVNYDTTHSVWKEQRIKTVALELMSGYTPSQIADKYAEDWEVSTGNIRSAYVKDARKLLAIEILSDESDIRLDLLAKYNYLFQLNMVRNDLAECRKLLDSITRLTQTLTSNVNLTASLQTINLVQVMREGQVIELESHENKKTDV